MRNLHMTSKPYNLQNGIKFVENFEKYLTVKKFNSFWKIIQLKLSYLLQEQRVSLKDVELKSGIEDTFTTVWIY